MRDFLGKVAVITGGADGMGFALAQKLAAIGMKIVIADIRADALQKAVDKLENCGAEALAVQTDVSKAPDMEALLQATLDRFGAVHILTNAAAASTRTRKIQETSVLDWEWGLGVNIWAILHGIRLFLPVMEAQGEPGHIINFSSVVSLASAHGLYGVCKHTVTALSEALYHDLAVVGSKIGVSVVMPGSVKTSLAANWAATAPPGVVIGAGFLSQISNEDLAAAALEPAEVADSIINGMENGLLYIIEPARFIELAALRLDQMENAVAPDIGQTDALWRRLHLGHS